VRVPPPLRGLLLPFALHNGRLIGPDRAVFLPPDARFACPVCGREVTLRTPERYRAHFAHTAEGTPGHSDEEIAHSLYVRILCERMRDALTAGDPYYVDVRCPICWEYHPYNLLEQADDVRAEAPPAEGVRSDILALQGTKPVRAVEVVVTHFPEPQAVRRYAELGIPVVEIVADRIPPPRRVRVRAVTGYVSREAWASRSRVLMYRSRLMCTSPPPCPAQRAALELGLEPLTLDILREEARASGGEVFMEVTDVGGVRVARCALKQYWLSGGILLANARITARWRRQSGTVWSITFPEKGEKGVLYVGKGRLTFRLRAHDVFRRWKPWR
jgi:hypothetical protein